MALGSSNVSFGNIQTEFGGSNPISLSEYYRGGSYVIPHGGNSGIPASGAISVSQFLSQSKRWIVSVTISANTADFNLRNYLNSNYNNPTGYPTAPTDVTVTVNSGVYVYSTSTSSPAFDTGDGWESSSTITIVNNGYIVGKGGDGGIGYNGTGGAGGNSINLRYPVTINNTNGYIYGGGGGGGGGGGMYYAPNGGYFASGGGGGGGQTFGTSTGGGQQGQNLTAVSYTVTQTAASGGNGSVTAAGAGGVGYQVQDGNENPGTSTAGTGGAGGAWGTAGSNGGTASGNAGNIVPNGYGVGGAAGKAIELNGQTATFTAGNNSTQVKGAQSTQTGSDLLFTRYSNGRTIYLVTLNTNKTNFNLYTQCGSPSGVVSDVTCTISTGVYVYSTSTATPGFTTGSGWGTGSTMTIVNNGYIIGMGGAGGNGSTAAGGAGNAGGSALSLTFNTTITNGSGYIFGGGGGGGGGGGSYHSSYNTYATGGGGGGGQSYQASGGGSSSGGNFVGYGGGGGTVGGAGAGGGGATGTSGGENPTLWYAGAGGAGGAWGVAGSGGASGSSGTTNYAGGGAGAAGNAISLNGYTVTFVSGNDSTHVQGAQS